MLASGRASLAMFAPAGPMSMMTEREIADLSKNGYGMYMYIYIYQARAGGKEAEGKEAG